MKTKKEIENIQQELLMAFENEINKTEDKDKIEYAISVHEALDTLLNWILEKKK